MNNELKEKFIEVLAKEGWSVNAMHRASITLGLHPEYHNILFPDGISEALSYYENDLDVKMINKLHATDVLPEKIREKIALALKIRIMPGHVPCLRSAWSTADLIWKFAGDKSTDFNYYTKRGLLSGIYIAAAKYRKSDHSTQAVNTDNYILSNLDRVIKIGQLKSKFPKFEDIPIIRYFI